VAGGDLIVLNKVDLVDAETLARVHAWIDSIRPGAVNYPAIEKALNRCRMVEDE
jgi:G3E family GTPase